MFFKKMITVNINPGKDLEYSHRPLTNDITIHRETQARKNCKSSAFLEQISERDLDSSYSSCRDKVLTSDMGGELGSFIMNLWGKRYRCLGGSSGHVEEVLVWYGYPHYHGLSDSKGERWWAYQICPKGGYQTAWWKISKLLISNEKALENANQHTRSNSAGVKNQNRESTSFESYCKILAVKPDCSVEEVKKNYRYFVKRFHPDMCLVEQEKASDVMKKLNEAYLALINRSKRRI